MSVEFMEQEERNLPCLLHPGLYCGRAGVAYVHSMLQEYIGCDLYRRVAVGSKTSWPDWVDDDFLGVP